MEGHTDLLTLILNNDERRKEVIKHKDIYGNNALHLVAYGRDASTFKLLIDSGVDINETNNVNWK